MINELKVKTKRENYEIPCIANFPEGMKKVIIAIHGFGSTKRSETIISLIRLLDEHNIGVISLDLPAHGDSEETGEYLTLNNCIDDIETVEEFLKSKFNEINIGFFASSFGAYLTLLKINKSRNKYGSVVLRCPAINMAKILEESLKIENTTLEEFRNKGYVTEGFARRFDVTYEMYKELLNNDVLKNYNSNNKILIIHGTEDTTAPISDSIKLKDKFSNYINIVKIEGANHRFQKTSQIEKVLDIATEYIVNS